MESFITLDMFLNLTACSMIVMVATQLIKKYVDYDAKWLALIMSAIVTAIRIIVVADYSLLGVLIGVMNIIPILLGAVGGYETILKPVGTLFNKNTKEEMEEEVK